MRFYALASAVGAAVLLSATSLSAQTCTTNGCTLTNTAQVTLGTLAELTVPSAPTNLTAPVVTDFNPTGDASKDNTGPLVHVRANTSWAVTVTSPALWGGTGNASKTSADLTWDKASNGSPTYTNLMGTLPGTLMSSPNASAGTDETIKYRTLWHITTDKPGDYSLVVTFTLSAP